MSNLVLFGIFIVGILLLVRTSGWLISLLMWMARYLKLSEYSVAFLLMAAATSLPELFVGINAAVQGIPHLALGNVLGANLLNLTFVIGIVALFKSITPDDERVSHEAGFIFALTFTPLILLLDGVLSRAEGALLVFLFFAYFRYLFVASKIPNSAVNALPVTPAAFGEFVRKIFLFLGGIGLLLVASQMVVFAGELGARRFGVPAFLIGLFVVSLGTTLPELTFGIRSVSSGHGGMGLGNAIGSVVFNLLFILGVAAIINPVTVLPEQAGVTFLILLAATAAALFINVVLKVSGRISRRVGVFLIGAYVLIMALVFQLSLL